MKIPTARLIDVAQVLLHSSNRTSVNEYGELDNNPEKKRLQALQEGLRRLESMPSPKQIANQGAANRVGFLQRRLEALKMMLLHASPQQAKALARELKSIAGELSSAAKELGGSAGGSGQGGQNDANGIGATASAQAASTQSGATTAPVAAGASQAAAANVAPKDDTGKVSAADRKTALESAKAPGANDDSAALGARNDSSSATIDGAALRALLMDAKKMLQEAINMLKSKLAEADKEGKQDIHDAERKLADIDNSLQQGPSPDIYSGLDGLPFDSGISNPLAVGSMVSVMV